MLVCWGVALRRDLLLPIAAKVGKSARRNLRFLHFRARCSLCGIVAAYHTPAGEFLFRFAKRIVSASAPLPLMHITNNLFGSTVEKVSGSGARGTDDASCATIMNTFCERVV